LYTQTFFPSQPHSCDKTIFERFFWKGLSHDMSTCCSLQASIEPPLVDKGRFVPNTKIPFRVIPISFRPSSEQSLDVAGVMYVENGDVEKAVTATALVKEFVAAPPLDRSSARETHWLPLRCALIKKHNGPQQFISRLLRPKCVLPDFLPVMRPFALWALTPGHESYLTEWVLVLLVYTISLVQTSGVGRQG